MKNFNENLGNIIVINSEPTETKIATIFDGEIKEFFIEKEKNENLLGNIYLAFIKQIMPSIDAMFLDIGLEKSVFLPFYEIKNFDISKYKINDTILVQIVKTPINAKGYKGTNKISLPGKYIVFSPFENGIGISKKIIDRKSIKEKISHFFQKIKGNFIIRTEIEEILELKNFDKIIKKEIKLLLNTWKTIKAESEKKNIKKPILLYKDFDIIKKIIREKLDENIDKFIIDSKEEYQKSKKFVKSISPNLIKKIEYFKGNNILEEFKIDKAIKNILNKNIFLPSGGYIIIEETEALCSIDVNTGKGKGTNLKEVTFNTNLEAAQIIPKEILLRNIGGIIIVDFVDMYDENDKLKIYETLSQGFMKDKARTKIFPINSLGLIEISRQRKSESNNKLLTEECPNCHGTGRIYSKDTIFSNIKLEIVKNLNETKNIFGFNISLNKSWEKYLTKEKMDFLYNNLPKNLEINIKFLNNLENNKYKLVSLIKTKNKK